VVSDDRALEQVQTILRSVKEHHLFAKGKDEKRQVLTRLLTEVGQLIVQTRPMVARLVQSRDRVTQSATATLGAMHEVANGSSHRSCSDHQPRWWPRANLACRCDAGPCNVRNKAGKKGGVGLPYLLSRLVVGMSLGLNPRGGRRVEDARAGACGYREIFGPQATPRLVVYDRGGYATATLRALANAGVNEIGIQPKGKGAWRVAEAVRETVQKRARQDRRDHWHTEDGQIWVQQTQRAPLADARDAGPGLSSPSICTS